jgi:hypothetical protein
MSSVSSTLPIELWHQILRSIYEVSLSSSHSESNSDGAILLRDYPWVDTLRSKRYRAAASARHGAVVRSIRQVCRSWRIFANQLRYQEIELGPFAFSFHDLLMERHPSSSSSGLSPLSSPSYYNSSSSIFNETRRLNVTAVWSDNTHDLALLVQSMPRLEWLQLSTHKIEESYLRTWLPSILGPRPQPCLLYLDLKPLHHKETIFIDPVCISLISNLATRLRRLICAIKYVPTSSNDGGGQMQKQMRQAPRFEDLQVLQLIDIQCDPGGYECEQAAYEWFSRWHLPSLKQFYIPRNWEYCTQLLDRGVGAQIEVLDASVCNFLFLFPPDSGKE